METILRSRSRIQDLLEASASLRRKVDLDAVISREIGRQRSMVGKLLNLFGEAPRVRMGAITYDREQVLGEWFPNDTGESAAP